MCVSLLVCLSPMKVNKEWTKLLQSHCVFKKKQKNCILCQDSFEYWVTKEWATLLQSHCVFKKKKTFYSLSRHLRILSDQNKRHRIMIDKEPPRATPDRTIPCRRVRCHTTAQTWASRCWSRHHRPERRPIERHTPQAWS